MLRWLHRVWLKHVLYRSRIPYPLWHEVISGVSVLSCLDFREQHRLRKLSSLFLHEKTISGAGSFDVDDKKRVYIAAQACLLILNLDLDYFSGWHEIIIYPDSFVIKREEYDDSGVVHETRRTLAGEAWGRGPVILSWSDARPGSHSHGPASNVILHEFAHKLDMLNGAANGMPPLHKNMVRKQWTASLSQAYDRLYHQIERHHHTVIDPYAAENPAEFFAVLTEVFFEKPDLLHKLYSQVYLQLSLYYRQDPLRHMCRHQRD
ncbi:MAG TPA: zinc-dependent peptidase [Gammaproteobacteria bacterium]|nr:zinc-dependent peptidase [Gammaproteobacteria bacterium]